MTRYDNTRPQIWRIPLHDQVQPSVTVTAPRGGYIVPAAYADWMREKLTVHGIEFRSLQQALPQAAVETFRATSTKIASATFEGRTPLTLEGAWKP